MPANRAGGTRARGTLASRTRLVEFAGRDAFSFRLPNVSAAAEQRGRAGERCLTNIEAFVNRIVVRHPRKFRMFDPDVRIACLPPRAWPTYDFTAKRVLFLLPSHALGDNVPVLTFLQALEEKFGLREIGVFCTGPTHDIYLTSPLVTAYPLWIPKRELRRWRVIVDLGHLERREDIDIWPIDMEAELLGAFALAPSRRYGGEARRVPQAPLSIGVLPLASSPLRTLPPAATAALVEALAGFGRVTLCLNRNQHQGVLYRRALGALDPAVEVVEAFDSIAALLAAVAAFDYAVFADSGPAHMAKLFGTPGVAVFTSAPGEVLQGRFANLTRWSVPFSGPHCAAPCGLARVRATRDGRVGCMGSLETALAALPDLPGGRRPDIVERLLIEEPVPCVARLRDLSGELAQFVVRDLEERRRRPGD